MHARDTKRVTRRLFLRLAMAAGLGTVLGACREREEMAPPPVLSGEGVLDAPANGSAARYREAPILAERVARGELPPVEERLPAMPFVLGVNEGIGAYGGAWRRAHQRWQRTAVTNALPVTRNMLCLDREYAIRPYIAESWEVNEEGTRLTWHLRRGMHWSDGAPVTSQDFRFSWFGDPNYTEDGQPTAQRHMDIELHDDYAFTVSRSTPSFVTLPPAYLSARDSHLVPSEYAKAFHPDYAEGGSSALRVRAEEEGYASLRAYYNAHVLQTGLPEPGTPTLLPWRPVTRRQAGTVLYERNPYYWQVDADGQQLPYLDRVVSQLCGGQAPLDVRVRNGDLDCQVEGLLGALEATYRETGYAVQHYPSGEHIVLQVNPTTSDESLAEMFQRREARQALSLAINRGQLAVVYGGGAEPRQFSPIQESPFYDEELSQQYLAYDSDLANRMLDELGYGERDGDGYRVSPRGNRLRVMVQSPYEAESVGGKIVAAVLGDLEALGLECEYLVRDDAEIHDNFGAGVLQACIGPLAGTFLPPLTELGGFAGLRWNVWSGGRLLRDDHPYRDLDALYEKMLLEPDLDRRAAIFREYLTIWKGELPVIGLLGGFQQVCIVRDGFMNVRDGLVYDVVTGYEAFQNPQQFCWERPQSHTLTEEEWEALRPLLGREETHEP